MRRLLEILVLIPCLILGAVVYWHYLFRRWR